VKETVDAEVEVPNQAEHLPKSDSVDKSEDIKDTVDIQAGTKKEETLEVVENITGDKTSQLENVVSDKTIQLENVLIDNAKQLENVLNEKTIQLENGLSNENLPVLSAKSVEALTLNHPQQEINLPEINSVTINPDQNLQGVENVSANTDETELMISDSEMNILPKEDILNELSEEKSSTSPTFLFSSPEKPNGEMENINIGPELPSNLTSSLAELTDIVKGSKSNSFTDIESALELVMSAVKDLTTTNLEDEGPKRPPRKVSSSQTVNENNQKVMCEVEKALLRKDDLECNIETEGKLEQGLDKLKEVKVVTVNGIINKKRRKAVVEDSSDEEIEICKCKYHQI